MTFNKGRSYNVGIMSNNPILAPPVLTKDTPPDKIPAILLTPLDWAMENQRLAAEYAGSPEAPISLANARRFLAISARLSYLDPEYQSR